MVLTIREDAATGCRAVGALEGLTVTIRDLPHPSVAIGCARQQDRGPRVPLHPLVREGGSASRACYPAYLRVQEPYPRCDLLSQQEPCR